MLAEYYSEKSEYNKVSKGRKDSILQLLHGAKGGKTVLDIGCGEGVLGLSIKKATGAAVYGVDISSSAIEKAKNILDAAFCADIERNEPWQKEITEVSYDYILMSEVLEHLFFPEHLLSQIKELAHKNTEIIITVPNILFWKNRLRILRGHFEYTPSGLMDRGHIHFFSWQALQDIVQSEGYHLIETSHHVPTRGTKWLGRFFPGLFAYQFIVKIKRNEN
jgi:SAM-dependent methyltransferase